MPKTIYSQYTSIPEDMLPIKKDKLESQGSHLEQWQNLSANSSGGTQKYIQMIMKNFISTGDPDFINIDPTNPKSLETAFILAYRKSTKLADRLLGWEAAIERYRREDAPPRLKTLAIQGLYQQVAKRQPQVFDICPFTYPQYIDSLFKNIVKYYQGPQGNEEEPKGDFFSTVTPYMSEFSIKNKDEWVEINQFLNIISSVLGPVYAQSFILARMRSQEISPGDFKKFLHDLADSISPLAGKSNAKIADLLKKFVSWQKGKGETSPYDDISQFCSYDPNMITESYDRLVNQDPTSILKMLKKIDQIAGARRYILSVHPRATEEEIEEIAGITAQINKSYGIAISGAASAAIAMKGFMDTRQKAWEQRGPLEGLQSGEGPEYTPEITGAVKLEENGIVLEMQRLPFGDIRHFYIGHDTGCCQFYGGLGSTCVQDAVKNPLSTTYVTFINGKIAAQSWVWMDQDAKYLCYDNIEISGWASKYKEQIKKLYYMATRYIVDNNPRIQRIVMGTRYGDAVFGIDQPYFNIKHSKSYSDASGSNQRILFDKSDDFAEEVSGILEKSISKIKKTIPMNENVQDFEYLRSIFPGITDDIDTTNFKGAVDIYCKKIISAFDKKDEISFLDLCKDLFDRLACYKIFHDIVTYAYSILLPYIIKQIKENTDPTRVYRIERILVSMQKCGFPFNKGIANALLAKNLSGCIMSYSQLLDVSPEFLDRARTRICRSGSENDILLFARTVDQQFHPVTFAAIIKSKSSTSALTYAFLPGIPPEQFNQLRILASKNSEKAYRFAKDIDKKYHPVTFNGVVGGMYAANYLYEFKDSIPTREEEKIFEDFDKNGIFYINNFMSLFGRKMNPHYLKGINRTYNNLVNGRPDKCQRIEYSPQQHFESLLSLEGLSKSDTEKVIYILLNLGESEKITKSAYISIACRSQYYSKQLMDTIFALKDIQINYPDMLRMLEGKKIPPSQMPLIREYMAREGTMSLLRFAEDIEGRYNPETLRLLVETVKSDPAKIFGSNQSVSDLIVNYMATFRGIISPEDSAAVRSELYGIAESIEEKSISAHNIAYMAEVLDGECTEETWAAFQKHLDDVLQQDIIRYAKLCVYKRPDIIDFLRAKITPIFAIEFAKTVDRAAHIQTATTAIQVPSNAILYLMQVPGAMKDDQIREMLREVVIESQVRTSYNELLVLDGGYKEDLFMAYLELKVNSVDIIHWYHKYTNFPIEKIIPYVLEQDFGTRWGDDSIIAQFFVSDCPYSFDILKKLMSKVGASHIAIRIVEYIKKHKTEISRDEAGYIYDIIKSKNADTIYNFAIALQDKYYPETARLIFEREQNSLYSTCNFTSKYIKEMPGGLEDAELIGEIRKICVDQGEGRYYLDKAIQYISNFGSHDPELFQKISPYINPENACSYGVGVPSIQNYPEDLDALRKIACSGTSWAAFEFAIQIDKAVHPDTLDAAMNPKQNTWNRSILKYVIQVPGFVGNEELIDRIRGPFLQEARGYPEIILNFAIQIDQKHHIATFRALVSTEVKKMLEAYVKALMEDVSQAEATKCGRLVIESQYQPSINYFKKWFARKYKIDLMNALLSSQEEPAVLANTRGWLKLALDAHLQEKPVTPASWLKLALGQI